MSDPPKTIDEWLFGDVPRDHPQRLNPANPVSALPLWRWSENVIDGLRRHAVCPNCGRVGLRMSLVGIMLTEPVIKFYAAVECPARQCNALFSSAFPFHRVDVAQQDVN